MSQPTEIAKTVANAMSSAETRKFIWEILCQCGLYETVSVSDAALVLMGRREVGIYILSLLEQADSTMYAKLILEMQGANDEQ